MIPLRLSSHVQKCEIQLDYKDNGYFRTALPVQLQWQWQCTDRIPHSCMNLQVCKHYIYASFSPTVGPFQTIVFKSADHYLVKQNVGKQNFTHYMHYIYIHVFWDEQSYCCTVIFFSGKWSILLKETSTIRHPRWK